MSIRTYNELGVKSFYEYDEYDLNVHKKVIVSDTISSLNVVLDNNNGIQEMLERVDSIGTNIKKIDDLCFYGCYNLKHVNIPETVRDIGVNAFKDCTKLSSFQNNVFTLPKNIGDQAFMNCNFSTLKLNTRINDLKIDEGQLQYDNDDYYTKEYNLGQRMFSNNNSLTDISMDNIILSPNMFDQCSSLSSVYFAEESDVVVTKSQPFNECSNLYSLTIPSAVTSYYDMHSQTLKGSAVTEVRLEGFLSAEAAFMCGGERKELVLATPIDLNDIQLGRIYMFQGMIDAKQNEEQQNKLNQLVETAINKHVPIITVSNNSRFIREIATNLKFIDWFKTKQCIMVITYDYDGSPDAYRMKNPEQRFDKPEYVLKPGMCNGKLKNYPQLNFNYTNVNGITQDFYKSRVVTSKTQMGGLRIKPYHNITKEVSVDGVIGVDLKQRRKIVDFYQILNKNGVLTPQKKTIMGENYSSDIDRITDDIMDTLRTGINNESYDNYYKKEKWNRAYDFNTVMCESDAITYLHQEDSPSFGWFWRKPSDDSISNMYMKLNDKEKEAFLNGEDFTTKKITIYINNECYREPASMYFTFTRQYRDPNFEMLVNDTLIGYDIHYVREPLVEGSSLNVIDREHRVGVSYRPMFIVESNNIYLKLNYQIISPNMRFERVDETGKSVRLTVESVEKFIDCIYKDIFQIKDDVDNFVEYQYVITKGDCWGVEHDCTVYDKDGNRHKFNYIT